MVMKRIFFMFYLILAFQGCILEDPLDKRDVKFLNKSKGAVYGIDSRTDSLDDHYAQLDDTGMEELFKTLQDSVILIRDKPWSWDKHIQNSKDGKLRFFVISKDSVDKYGWRKIKDRNIYTKVYKVTIEDLNKLKWTIVYDGK